MVSFHSMQADWQALQPMHLETSISFATGVSCRAGGGRSSLAERLITSLAPKLFTKPSVGGLLTAVRGLSNIIRPPHRPGGRFDIHQEGLVFRCIDIRVADKRGERIRTEAFSGYAGETPMQRDAHDMDCLAVADQRPDPFGHDRLRLDRAALRPDAHPSAELDAFFLGELFRYLHEEFRL